MKFPEIANSESDIRLQKFLDRSEIETLLSEYTHLVDWMRWADIDNLFWPEANFDFGMFKGDLPSYRDFVSRLEEGYRRRLHMFATPRICIAGDSARIDVGSVIVCRTENSVQRFDDIMYGRYIFEAEKRDGIWKLGNLVYLLNLSDSHRRIVADEDSSMNFANDLGPKHPLADRS